MKGLKSFSLAIILALAVASVFGMVKGLAILCFSLGVGELINAKECYDIGKRKTALLYLIIGVIVCVCGVFSFTNII